MHGRSSARSLFLVLGLLGAACCGAAQAEGFGPPEWTQYRAGPSRNAVYDSGAPAQKDTRFKTGDQVRATPVIVGDRLYIGNHETGGMFAFDAKTGRTLWHDNNPYFRHAPNWIHSDMVYAKGRLYVGYGNRVFESATVRGTGRSGAMAVDPQTGATLWDYQTEGEVMPTPALWNGTLYIVTGAGELIALDPRDGQRLWHLSLPGWVSMSSPAVQDGTLYVGSLNSVVAVDLDKRKIRWKYEEIGTFTDVPPAVGPDGTVVITAMKSRSFLTPEERRLHPTVRGDVHFIYAFDGKSGKLLWRHLLGSGASQDNNTSGAPTVADGRVYVGSPYTLSLQAYDLKSGDKLWEYPVAAKIKGAPAVKDGHVFFGDTAGFLHVIEADSGEPPLKANGQPVPRRKLGGSVNAAKNVALAPGGPVVINQNVFVGSQDSFVYSVSIPAWLGTTARTAQRQARSG